MSNLDKKAMCKTCIKAAHFILARRSNITYVAIMYFAAVEKYPLGLAK